MALSDFVIDRRTISQGAANFSVRALNFNDFTVLISQHQESLDRALASISAGKLDSSSIDLASMLTLLPNVVAQAIALAADEPDQAAKVQMLPFGIQLQAAAAVWDLTVEQAGGLEKLMGDVTAALRGTTGALQQAVTGSTALLNA